MRRAGTESMVPTSPSAGLHPHPPVDLHSRSLPLQTHSGPWFRIHPADYGPLFFGRTGTNRFDSASGRFGVLYVGLEPACAFIESFGSASLHSRAIPTALLASKKLGRVRSTRPLSVVALDGNHLNALSATPAF